MLIETAIYGLQAKRDTVPKLLKCQSCTERVSSKRPSSRKVGGSSFAPALTAKDMFHKGKKMDLILCPIAREEGRQCRELKMRLHQRGERAINKTRA
jgi:hypothetical protein